jgi:hypothetical protein
LVIYPSNLDECFSKGHYPSLDQTRDQSTNKNKGGSIGRGYVGWANCNTSVAVVDGDGSEETVGTDSDSFAEKTAVAENTAGGHVHHYPRS